MHLLDHCPKDGFPAVSIALNNITWSKTIESSIKPSQEDIVLITNVTEKCMTNGLLSSNYKGDSKVEYFQEIVRLLKRFSVTFQQGSTHNSVAQYVNTLEQMKHVLHKLTVAEDANGIPAAVQYWFREYFHRLSTDPFLDPANRFYRLWGNFLEYLFNIR